MFYAHSTEDESKAAWQTLAAHSRNVADMAAGFAAIFDAQKAARLCGLLHDLGKYNPAFQRYIEGRGSSVDHATAGAAVLMRTAVSLPAQMAFDKLVLELLAHAIAGHHGGLPDRLANADSSGRSLKIRVEDWKESTLDPAWKRDIDAELSGLFPQSFSPDKRGKIAAGFQLSFLGRMIFSCLVDADFKDTEAFYSYIDGREIDRRWPQLKDELPRLQARFNSHMARKAKADTPVNRLRGEILEHVRVRAGSRPGVFTLNVPTGGGKTLASLGFALDHASAHDKRRIIYAIPFTSIIDQTAAIFRDVLGEDVVLEHHSAIEEEQIKDRERQDKLKLAMEDWAAPVIVTTNVQLFESLFSNRPSRCRKLHNIAGSIIILDEAQTLPLKLLRPAVMALDELARNYGCTIVLCTATQPALDRRNYDPKTLMGLEIDGRELAPDPARLARELKRANIVKVGVLNDEDLVAALQDEPQSLVIVNSRKHALDLYSIGREAGLGGLIHLTTRQCAAHRKVILDDVRTRLKDKAACRVIATSLIEAGVDVDFPKVWRAEAGLDQVLQAAGRCNREGSRPPEASIVPVFQPADHRPPPEIRQFAEVFHSVANKPLDLFSPEAVKDYFEEVYWRRGDGLDGEGILKLSGLDRQGTNIAYRRIAERFRMIESGMLPVIIPFDDHAREWIRKLTVKTVSTGRIARELQRYVVQVPPRARALLISNGHATFHAQELRGDQFAVLDEKSGLYKREWGLLWDDAEYLRVENSIV